MNVLKATDFYPEHFDKGQTFDRNDFAEYVRASDEMSKVMYSRWLPCAAAGVLLSVFLSFGIGGSIGNILAVVSIFAGLIAGGAFNIKARRRVDVAAKRLGITKEDVSRAAERVKEGTYAWTDPDYPPRPVVMTEAERTAGMPAEEEKPLRALAAAGLLIAGWLVLAVFQIMCVPKIVFSDYGTVCLSAGLLGAAAYLVSAKGAGNRIIGAALGLPAALLINASEYVRLRRENIMLDIAVKKNRSISCYFMFRYPDYMLKLRLALITVFFCLAAAFVLSLMIAKAKKKAVFCGLIAAAVYMIRPGAFTSLGRITNVIARNAALVNAVVPPIVGAVSIIIVSAAVSALCVSRKDVKPRGIGLVWCWLALAGSVFTVGLALYAGIRGLPSVRIYDFAIIGGLSGLIGYIMLLRGKRPGLYIIITGVGLMLCAQLTAGVLELRSAAAPALIYGIVPSVLGALNPLFAWLSARAGLSPRPAEEGNSRQ